MTTKPDSVLRTNYDANADVLYVTLGRAREAWCEEDEKGLVWRHDEANDRLFGVTILSFRKHWSPRERELARVVAKRLSISFDVLLRELHTAIDSADQMRK
jgi:hypothetical protein